MNRDTRETVLSFLHTVRSGESPERTPEFLADTVLAHQVSAPDFAVIERSPSDYTAHVEEMLEQFGRFEFSIDELLVDGDRAYARWTQRGAHHGFIDGLAPTGRSVVTAGSAVYRVANGKIVEYWIQQDAAGLQSQLTA